MVAKQESSIPGMTLSLQSSVACIRLTLEDKLNETFERLGITKFSLPT